MSAIRNESELVVPSITGIESLQAYVTDTPSLDTHNGNRVYKHLCVAMKTIDGLGIVVRKDLWVDSSDPSDWFVAREVGGRITKDKVLQAKTDRINQCDEITLQLVPDVSHHGPYTLRFSVDEVYQQASEVVLSHQRYYGRGVGRGDDVYIDAVYERSIMPEDIVANVVSIDVARQRRIQHAARGMRTAN